MAQGLQVFDENGNLQIDVSTQLTKILGEFVIRPKDGNGEKVDERLTMGIPFWIITYLEGGKNMDDNGEVEVEIEKTIIKWKFREKAWRKYIVRYGVF